MTPASAKQLILSSYRQAERISFRKLAQLVGAYSPMYTRDHCAIILSLERASEASGQEVMRMMKQRTL